MQWNASSCRGTPPFPQKSGPVFPPGNFVASGFKRKMAWSSRHSCKGSENFIFYKHFVSIESGYYLYWCLKETTSVTDSSLWEICIEILSTYRYSCCLSVSRKNRFLRWGVVSTSTNPKLEDHPLSAAHDCLFNLFAATLHIGGLSSIRKVRTLHAAVTGTPWCNELSASIKCGEFLE